MHRTLTIVAVLAVLLATVSLYAQDLPRIEPPRMPEPPKIWPPQPPIREPPIWPPRPPICPPTWPPICPPILPPRPVAVELRGYIYPRIGGPIDPLLFLSTAEYYIRTVGGRIYMLRFTRATKFYLCEDFTNYVGTEKLVIVKGFLQHNFFPRPFEEVFVTEVRDPAYPHCR